MKFKLLRVLTSSGKYTLQTDIDGFKSQVPCGTSKSKYEAKPSDFGKIDEIQKELNKKLNSSSFPDLDSVLELEKETEKYGTEVCLGVSYSLLRRMAYHGGREVWELFTKRKSYPRVVSKIMGGGAHFPTGPSIQEFLYSSKQTELRKNIEDNLKMYYDSRKVLIQNKNLIGMDLEGGMVPNFGNDKTLEFMKDYGSKGDLGIDFAATGKYTDRTKQIEYTREIIKKFNLFFVEDPLGEDDFEGFAKLNEEFGKNMLIVGDDLLSTNPDRLSKGINLKTCGGCIVKPDQAGSLSRTIDFVKLAHKNKLKTVISHRSNETTDTIISDLAVGLGIPMIKISIINGERVSKLNRLMEIMEG